MKKIYLTLLIAFFTCLQSSNAGPIRPLTVTYLDIALNGFFCSSTTTSGPGLHLEIRHNSSVVKGRGTGCLNSALDQQLIGTVGNLDGVGSSISIFIPGLQQLLIIDDSPKRWYSYNTNDLIPSTGDYFLGAPF